MIEQKLQYCAFVFQRSSLFQCQRLCAVSNHVGQESCQVVCTDSSYSLRTSCQRGAFFVAERYKRSKWARADPYGGTHSRFFGAVCGVDIHLTCQGCRVHKDRGSVSLGLCVVCIHLTCQGCPVHKDIGSQHAYWVLQKRNRTKNPVD